MFLYNYVVVETWGVLLQGAEETCWVASILYNLVVVETWGVSLQGAEETCWVASITGWFNFFW